jgi:N-methylhydantoinase A/oxoprolinase/acetone carboxylase beta subunit
VTPALRIGVDVGGTHTDAVLMRATEVVAKRKCATTPDVTRGIVDALTGVLGGGTVALADISAVMIGTTHFTNAFVEAKGLASVAIVRLGYPATQAVPPLSDWPDRLVARLRTRWFLCHGGYEYDGREITAVDPGELARVAEEIRLDGLQSVAVTGVFAPVNPDAEQHAALLLSQALPGVPVSISSEIGRMGMLARENATIINASLQPMAHRTVRAFRRAVDELVISAPVYVSQNDGTLASLDHTERYPVTTFASGPTNSMRGAAFLSGLTDCAVVDIGGTTADIGVVQRGFPRETTMDAEIGGVPTNFRLPDVVSLGIGGGSIVDLGALSVGPESVGSTLTETSLVFGGGTTTATDLAVADGRAEVGDKQGANALPSQAVTRLLAQIEQRIAIAVDSMRTEPGLSTVVLAGGGSILLRDELEGCAVVVRPEHFEVANAVGAAIAQVGSTIERIFPLATVSRIDATAEVIALATDAAIVAGAHPQTVRVVDVEETLMSYLPEEQTRIKVKAVGDLCLEVSNALAQ